MSKRRIWFLCRSFKREKIRFKQHGIKLDGFIYEGKPVVPGFTAIRQAGESIPINLVLEDGQIAYIIPKPFDPRVAPQVAKAVAKAAMETGVARRQVELDWVVNRTKELVRE